MKRLFKYFIQLNFIILLVGCNIQSKELTSNLMVEVSLPWEEGGSSSLLMEEYEDVIGKRYSSHISNVGGGVQFSDQFVSVITKKIDSKKFHLTVIVNNKAEYTTEIANLSGQSGLVNVWVYEDNWAIEIVQHLQNEPIVSVDIIINGVSVKLNKDYQEVFGFQILADKPFYFFKKDNDYGISYDGSDVSIRDLGFDHITYRNAWFGYDRDPVAYENAVLFWATKDGKNYSVLLGNLKK